MDAMDLLDALEDFLRQCEANGRSPHTIRQYERHIGLLASWARSTGRSTTLANFDHRFVALFLASPAVTRSATGSARKPSSANALRSSLRTFFAYARAAGFLERDPARLVKRAKTGSSAPRGLTVEQRDRLLTALATARDEEGHRDRVLFTLMLGSGIRVGSALALDVSDLDLADGRVRLRRMKGGGEHDVFVSDRVGAELALLMGDRTQGPIFLARGGRRITMRQVQRRLAQWLVTAGIQGRFSPHSLRHTFATELYHRTGDVALVRAALGHASITSTMIYARVDQQRLREAVGLA
jgi:integrase/recombinase XerC